MGNSASSRTAFALRRWRVQCAFALVILAMGYIQGAGLITRLVFQPQVERLPYATQLQTSVLGFFKPVFLIAGSGRSPNLVSQIVAVYLDGNPEPAGRQLLALARTDKAAGRLESARRIACLVQYLGIKYNLFDDRPEIVLADLARELGGIHERELLAAWTAPTEPGAPAPKPSYVMRKPASGNCDSNSDICCPDLKTRRPLVIAPDVLAEAPATNSRY